MDRYSILDHEPAAPADAVADPSNRKVSGRGGSSGETLSVSARIAHANSSMDPLPAPLASDHGLRFPGDDGGRSLAAMAERDLDAALQLLAERAQYITGASGAAIALRHGAAHDMLCRASAGSNAPELGALLSTEHGLSGESVRTRRALRCDDAESDPRVNRDGCRQLGIASVVIMPIVGDEHVMGVFELFSGKASAFTERDIAALERLGRMVETAVEHAVASQTRAEIGETLPADVPPPAQKHSSKPAAVAVAHKAAPVEPENKSTPEPERAADLKRPLFWSATIRAQGAQHSPSEDKPLAIPPVLRQLQKCEACGFPVSPGRNFCVECEDKQWHGERLPQPAPEPLPAGNKGPYSQQFVPALNSHLSSARESAEKVSPALAVAIAEPDAQAENPGSADTPTLARDSLRLRTDHDGNGSHHEPLKTTSSEISAPFLGSALPAQSWFAANKYILGAMVVAAIVVTAIVWLH